MASRRIAGQAFGHKRRKRVEQTEESAIRRSLPQREDRHIYRRRSHRCLGLRGGAQKVRSAVPRN